MRFFSKISAEQISFLLRFCGSSINACFFSEYYKCQI